MCPGCYELAFIGSRFTLLLCPTPEPHSYCGICLLQLAGWPALLPVVTMAEIVSVLTSQAIDGFQLD